MYQYPKWLLCILLPSLLIPIGTSIFYLFGGIHFYPEKENVVFCIIQYVVIQLLWLLPLVLFFSSLYLCKQGKERASYIIALVALLLCSISIVVLIRQDHLVRYRVEQYSSI